MNQVTNNIEQILTVAKLLCEVNLLSTLKCINLQITLYIKRDSEC